MVLEVTGSAKEGRLKPVLYWCSDRRNNGEDWMGDVGKWASPGGWIHFYLTGGIVGVAGQFRGWEFAAFGVYPLCCDCTLS